MDIHPIRTEADYAAALDRIEKLWGAALGTRDGDALDVLTTLVEAYEAKRHPIPPPDPIEAIRFYMDQNGLGRADLDRVIGSQSHASEILTRKRSLSLAMIRAIAANWQIPVEILIRPTAQRGPPPRRRGRKPRGRAAAR
jgi:HTH-type transcriptional regulator/antitoxin HigA